MKNNLILAVIVAAGLMGCQKTKNSVPTSSKKTSANIQERNIYISVGGDTTSKMSVNGIGYKYQNGGIWESSIMQFPQLAKGDKVVVQTNNVLQGQEAAWIFVDTIKSNLAVNIKESISISPGGSTIDSTSNPGEYFCRCKTGLNCRKSSFLHHHVHGQLIIQFRFTKVGLIARPFLFAVRAVHIPTASQGGD